MKKPIAIFDIDGTIFRSSLVIELYSVLVKMGIFSQKSLRAIEKKKDQWLNREGGYDKYMWEVVDWYGKEIKGVKKQDLIKASRKLLQDQKFRQYRYSRNLIKKARKKYHTIGISGSPLEVVGEYNKVLKFDKMYGTEWGMDEKGRYTGVILHSPPRYKKELITRYVASHNLSFKGSIGVGDTEDDIGFLELVDKPIAFNPNMKLAKHARKKGWTVVIERKDLIVEFKPKSVRYLHLD